MPLSTVTVTGGASGWVTPDGVAASGSVILQPLQEYTGGGYVLAQTPVSFTVTAGQVVPPNTIASNAQFPGLQYVVTEQIRGVTNPPPYAVTPSGSVLDLSTTARGTPVVYPQYLPLSAVGAANGVCELDGTAKVPLSRLPSGSGVQSVTEADATIVVGGTATNPTVGVGAVPESKVTGLPADLAALSTAVATKATTPTVRRAYITSGDTTLPNTGAGWAIVSGFEIDLPAAAGDTVEISFSAMRSQNANAFLDAAVVTGGTPTIQRYMATGSGTPAIEGEPDWYIANTFIGHAAPHSFVVASGDLDGGSVRFALVCKSNGTGTVYSSANYPFYWQATNYGVVS